jgi:photosystem II stability/assembly factor-like uncharacterized protein
MLDRMDGLMVKGCRRRFLKGSMALGLAKFCSAAKAQSFSSLDPALNTAAISVRYPERVTLIAITLTTANRLVAAGEHGVIVYSDDNGRSWLQARVPVNLSLTCVRFATAKIGWAGGHAGVILKTDDGGESWTKQLDGNQANQLTMKVARDPALSNNASPATALAMLRAQHFVDGGADIPFLTMLVFSPEKMLALGGYRMAMLTDDGGKTWRDGSLNVYSRTSINIYDAEEIGGSYYLVAEMGLVFRSSDGGNSFQPVTSPGQTTLFGILGATDGSLLVFGVAGSVFRSQDEGASWAPSQIDTKENLSGGRVLSNGAVVLASESGQIYTSKDNGRTFSPVLSNPRQPLFDIQGASNGTLIGVGPTGVVCITESLLTSGYRNTYCGC